MAHERTAQPSAGELLASTPVQELAGRIVAEAERLAGCAVALYVMDVSGAYLRRAAGGGRSPEEIAIPMAIGPELPADRADELSRRLEAAHEGAAVQPLWLRQRALGVLISECPPAAPLDELAREAAAAMELADGYGDMFEGPRRRAPMSPAAELQENLLPPRICQVPGAEIAAHVLPAYEVGGDWFDMAITSGGVYLAIADAVGKGPRAAALSALTVGAQRAVRRRGGTLEEMAVAIHEAVQAFPGDHLFVTAILADWRPDPGELSWILCGHPPPLRVDQEGHVEELSGPGDVPLGLPGGARQLKRGSARLEPGEAVVLYSDGIIDRRDEGGDALGVERLCQTIATARPRSATAIAAAIQERVLNFAEDPLRDDATILVLARPSGN